jgi:hypothetical protein
LIHSFY